MDIEKHFKMRSKEEHEKIAREKVLSIKNGDILAECPYCFETIKDRLFQENCNNCGERIRYLG